MNDSSRGSGFFRCPVQRDHSRASLQIGRGRVPAVLQETSIDGFTLTVAPRYAARLRLGRPWMLRTASEKAEVHAEWVFHAPDGHIQLGVRRLRDLTPAEGVAKRWGFGLPLGRKNSHTNTPEVVFAGLVAILIVILSMPGLGDHLGTAPRIRAALNGVVNSLTVVVRAVL